MWRSAASRPEAGFRLLFLRSAMLGGIGEKKDKDRRKAKVVAAIWRTEFIQSLATLAIFHYSRTILKKRINSSFSLHHPSVIHPIIPIFLVQNS